ncbi:hypothetical protein LJC14_01285, partial [Treponema sp. OttesenSCG-928-L16]|nr:hypothetical protein [Treponema sp. OttesenSCG-928-L16]
LEQALRKSAVHLDAGGPSVYVSFVGKKQVPFILLPPSAPWYRAGLLLLCMCLLAVPLMSQETGPAPDAGGLGKLLLLLEQAGIEYEERPLFAEYGSFASSVHVDIPEAYNTGGSMELFILAVPLHPEFDTGTELPYDISVALDFIEKASEKSAGFSLKVAFLGGEYSLLPPDERKDGNTGLKDLLDMLDAPEQSVLVYFDFLKSPGSVEIHHGSRGMIAPLSIIRPLPELCLFHGVPYEFFIRSNELYKLGLAEGPAVLNESQGREIPSLYLKSGSEKALDSQDTSPGQGSSFSIGVSAMADLLADYAFSLQTSPENMDFHYSILHIGRSAFFISEQLTLLMLISSAALLLVFFLAYSVISRRMLIVQWRIFIRRIWVLPILFLLLIVSFRGAELFFYFVLNLFGIKGNIVYHGGIFIRFILACGIYNLFSPFFDFIRIPRKANFYGNAAVILVSIGVLITTVQDITFVPGFLWTLLFVLLAALIRIPVLVFACAILAPIQVFGSILDSLAKGNLGLLTIFLSPDILLSVYTSVVALPILLLFKRGSLLLQGRRPRPSLQRRLIPRFSIFTAALIVLGIYFFSISRVKVIPPFRKVINQEQEAAAILDMDMQTRTFLERNILEVKISAQGEPVRFDLSIDSLNGAEPLVIYDASMAFNLSADASSCIFLLGEGPPNPFEAEIVLPLDFRGRLRAGAVYNAWDSSLDPQQPENTEDYVLTVERSIPLSD